ncbi:hypothetical protein BaOVIS_001090 [Babesia ovis]|uniref:Uncharacterized protein n=1 Tax=Babesia ovis TaxID=5869 RepID=A0A9W5T7L0_BABOV|nr:hypothetical protein BaOVIS_001090 [Babesia ovis]
MRSLSSSACHRLLALPRITRPFSSSRQYDPNVVNECLNPRPGKRFRTMRLIGGIGVFLVATPLIVMHFDSKRFEAEMERRRQANAASEDAAAPATPNSV